MQNWSVEFNRFTGWCHLIEITWKHIHFLNLSKNHCFRLKARAKNDGLKYSPRAAKIATLSFIPEVKEWFTLKLLIYTLRTKFDLATKKIFMKKWYKLPEICFKNLVSAYLPYSIWALWCMLNIWCVCVCVKLPPI